MTARRWMNYPATDDMPTVITIWVGDVQIAGAVRQSEDSYKRCGYRWQITSTDTELKSVSPVAARTEKDARAWLSFLADLYEREPNEAPLRCGECGTAKRVSRDDTLGGEPICPTCLDDYYAENGLPTPAPHMRAQS